MTRWCKNTLQLVGDENQMAKACSMLGEFALVQQAAQKPMLPAWCDPSLGGHFFDLSVDGTQISYRTRWMPNLAELVDVADHFGIGFVLRYEGEDFNCYGMSTYEDGVLEDVSLDAADFRSYDTDAHKRAYVFEGRDHKDRIDIHELLLGRKASQARIARQSISQFRAELPKGEMRSRIYFHSAMLVEGMVERLFADMHHIASTSTGDIDPRQAQELDEIKLGLVDFKARLSELVAMQTWQNTEQFDDNNRK